MKKVLSFVLILALVLGSFSFAFGLSDIEDSANTEAITVASDLGIITGYEDGTFLPEKTVNRAEFAAMITRALAVPDSALAAYSATSFKDTSGYGWAVPYLAFCESKGIMIGDGYGNVMPGRTINVNEAITMAVRAIGYTENSSMLVGTWPSNYVTLAQTLGLYDDVAAATMVSRESAAQVIYNALTVTLVTVNADGATNKVMDGDDEVSMITAGLGAKIEKDVIVEGDEPSNINLVKYLGAYANVYKNSEDKIIAVGKVHSEFLTGDFTGTSYDTFEVDDVEYTFASTASISGTPPAIKVVNGVHKTGTVTGGSLTGTSVTLAVKLSGKTIKEVYSVATWEDGTLKQATSTTVKMINEDKVLNGKDFTLDDNDKIDLNSFVLHGVAKLQDIAEDNIVQVWVGDVDVDDKDKITKVKVGTKTVTGQVTKIAKVDSVNEYTIDGKVYNSYDEDDVDPAITETGTAYLTFDGDIGVWDVEDGSTGNYAVLTDDIKNITGGYTNTSQVSLFYKDGVKSLYTFDGTVGTAASAAGVDKGDLVKFKLNSDGEITTMTAVGITAAATKLSAKGTYDGRLLADTVLVFVSKAGLKFEIGALADVAVDEDIFITYGVNGKDKIDVMIVDAADAGAKATYGFVVSTAKGMNDDGDEAAIVTAFVNGEEVTYIADDIKDYSGYVNQLAKFDFAAGKLDTISTMGAIGVITSSNYNATSAGSVTYSAAGGFGHTTVAGVSDKRINVTTNAAIPDYKLVDDSATVLYAKFDGDKFDKFVKSDVTSINTNYHVYMIQLDKDSVVFDLVIYVKTADVSKISGPLGLGTLN